MRENFRRWNDALLSNNYDSVAGLDSSTELSFLPTVSPEFIRDTQSTRQYFIDFLKKLPEGTITADKVQKYGDEAYLHTGMYTFMTGPESDRQPVNARFRYVAKQLASKLSLSGSRLCDSFPPISSICNLQPYDCGRVLSRKYVFHTSCYP